MAIATLHRMEVYGDSVRLATMVNKFTKWLPRGSQQGLIEKIRVAANAIPLIIEEGWDGVKGPNLYKALSTSYELLSGLEHNIGLCKTSLFFNQRKAAELLLKIDQLKRSITGYKSQFYKRTD